MHRNECCQILGEPTSLEESKPTLACSHKLIYNVFPKMFEYIHMIVWCTFNMIVKCGLRCDFIWSGHVLYTSEIATQAAGVAILLHRKHAHGVGQAKSFKMS